MSRAALELIDVTKHFHTNWTRRTIRAVEGLSFAVNEGEVYGLIGHNGAGKTTTFKLLLGLLRLTHGTVLWEGEPLQRHTQRAAIGFSPEQPYFYDYLTVQETLNFYGQLYGMSGSERQQRIAELATDFGITHKLNAAMRTLSKRMLQRVAVAQAIMHRPRLAILEALMSELDPGGRKDMRDLIASLKHNVTTVLFSSHILSDAEALCDRVGILARGRLQEIVEVAANGDTPTAYVLVVVGAPSGVIDVLRLMAIEPLSGGPERCTAKLKDQGTVNAALSALHGTPARVEALLPERPSLEQRFLQYVKDGSNVE